MKIAVISNSAFALTNFRGHLLAEMRARGHEVFAFAPDHDATSRATLQAIGVRPVDCSMSRTGTNPIKEARTIFTVYRLLGENKIDLCFAFFMKPVIYATIAAWLARVPSRYTMIEGLGFAFTARPNLKFSSKIIQGMISAMMRFSLGRSNRTIFLNKDDQEEFLQRGLISSEKSVVLGGIGVDLAEWGYQAPKTAPVTFILMARLLRDKGIEQYIAAARILRVAHPETRFILVGGLDENPSAITGPEVRSWVDEGLVEWPGHVNVQPWLARASVFVLPSYYREGVPRSTQEAMALGLPVITTDVPGCRDTVEHGRNGYLVPIRDPAALAEAMRHFIVRPDAIIPMGLESRKIAEARFDVHEQNRKLLGFLNL